MDLADAASILQAFTGSSLTRTLARLESSVRGATSHNCAEIVTTAGATEDTLAAARRIKEIAGQINVAIHAVGLLLCLPKILESDETIEYVSLGAGNTGRQFDLETNRRIAEFKFIGWRGGPESIRQNSVFKDFYWLAECDSPKQRFLYVIDTSHPLKFLNGGRALSSVLSRDSKLQQDFASRFGDRFRTVRDYYAYRKDRVSIQSVSSFLPDFVRTDADP